MNSFALYRMLPFPVNLDDLHIHHCNIGLVNAVLTQVVSSFVLEVYVFSRQSIGVHVSGHHKFWIILYVKKQVKEHVVLLEIHLRTTGRHLSMGSHSVICLLAQICVVLHYNVLSL